MNEPNFLPINVKQETIVQPKPIKVGRTWRDKIVLGLIFGVLIFLVAFGYPAADAVYRGYKILPIVQEVKNTAQAGEYENLYPQVKELRYQLSHLSRDTKALSSLSFIPGIGPEIKKSYYTARGSERLLTAVLPVIEVFGKSEHLSDLSDEERRNVINYLASQSTNINLAASQLSAGQSFWTPEEMKEVIPVLQKFAYISPELPNLLGVNEPKRYLVLFANNLEIRPAGGFIGSYAVVTVKDGSIAEVLVRDSYDLPRARNVNLGPTAPAIMQQYLRIRGLTFRDSTWFPDYPTTAVQAKQGFIREGGQYATEISGVFMVTTEILKELLKITGPIKVETDTYNADNVIVELQKQVELDFYFENIPFSRRKDVVGTLAQNLKDRFDLMPAAQKIEIIKVFGELAERRHAAFYFEDGRVQSLFAENGWDGRMLPYQSDTLMVVDTNLMGWKTEPVMTKTYTYDVDLSEGQGRAHLDVHYHHRGQFNPLVSNYRTYVRVFAPKGSKLISSSAGPVDVTEENDRTVFGVLTTIPVGQEKTISFDYLLPQNIKADNYQVRFLKQLGAYPVNLRINADFGSVNKSYSEFVDTNKDYLF